MSETCRKVCRNHQAQSLIVESFKRRRARRPVLLHLTLLQETDTDLQDVVQTSCLIDIVLVAARRLLPTAEVSVSSAGTPIEVMGAGAEVSTPLPYNRARREKKSDVCRVLKKTVPVFRDRSKIKILAYDSTI